MERTLAEELLGARHQRPCFGLAGLRSAQKAARRGDYNGDFQLCISRVLLAEFESVLARPKFAARLQQGCLSLDLIVRDLEAIAFLVAPAEVRRMVPDDPADDYVIATVLAGGADLIVTGDRRHLLPLRAVEGIPIVTAAEAVARLEVDDANS